MDLPAEQPILYTSRLVLRPFVLADVAAVVALAGDRAVAENTLSIPHPYSEAEAEEWINQRPTAWAKQKAINYAITLPDDTLCGSVGLALYPVYNMAELGYWIGRPYWGQGYATEAGAAVVDFGFSALGLNRVNAVYFGDNLASGRVMEKLGMAKEGYRRRQTPKWGVYRDVALCGLLREDWEKGRQP
ncbi:MULTISPECIES: GNAT family N-acetyltransferase [Cyanophyceae]|uniref:GNAT family N-acetyltransferase n=1 Tax=Leptolyngbya subtilissima DQ-A4 TaxID=2933933 RepID=A0ABV0K5H7_9CYAN|nr:GNAT family N-acetyltransferase [Nodosilinea sp. FACHB-141]MBD2114367.1 GNAT family N-acetyltransferase [Nodosilinea sp. FACHB-141]